MNTPTTRPKPATGPAATAHNRKRTNQLQALLAQARRAAALEKNLQQFLDFFQTLPPGWLGKTVADIGLLNDAYCEARRLGMEVDGTQKQPRDRQ